jgi:hypothetical protein
LLVGPTRVHAPSLVGPFVVRSALVSVATVSVFFVVTAIVAVAMDVIEALDRADPLFDKPSGLWALTLISPLVTGAYAILINTRLIATARAIRYVFAGAEDARANAPLLRAQVPGKRAPLGRGFLLALVLFEAPFLGRPWVYTSVQLDAAWSIELAAFLHADVSPSATFHPLGTAVRHGSVDVVRSLLKCGPGDVDAPDVEGRTALAMAAELIDPAQHDARKAIVDLLLEYGANAERAANDGVTPRDRLRAVGINLAPLTP